MQVAIITGVTGQDGSYLSELLLEKGYKVLGMLRRRSNIDTRRLDHIFAQPNFELRYGDVTDISSILSMLKEAQAINAERIEFYNLAAQSHVRVSFANPMYTTQSITDGTLNCLEAIRALSLEKVVRFYQASSSEMFGQVLQVPQNEDTPLNPRSPYAAAKAQAHYLIKVYRDAYGIFACSGVLFNHETLAAHMPLIFKHDGQVDIKPISEIVQHHTLTQGCLVDEEVKAYQAGHVETDLHVWDVDGWTKVKFASGYPHDQTRDNKEPRFIVSKNAAYFVTGSHEIIMDDQTEKPAAEIELGDKVHLVPFPDIPVDGARPGVNEDSTCTHDIENPLECGFCNHVFSKVSILNAHISRCEADQVFLNLELNETEAELLGLMVGDGYVGHSIQFTNKDLGLIDRVVQLWYSVCERNGKVGTVRQATLKSGFNQDVEITQLYLQGFAAFFRKKYRICNQDHTKRVPVQILNSAPEIQLKFLEGYQAADGLKAGHGNSAFRNFKTNSAVLAQGLVFLISKTTQQDFTINVETKKDCDTLYYSINLASNTTRSLQHSADKAATVRQLIADGQALRVISRETGISRKFVQQVARGYQPSGIHHFQIPPNQVKKILERPAYDGWFYDLETESGTFHAGIGLGHIHNSPRRGATFVTRKISKAVAEDRELVLGNLDALRDWGHSRDYVRGMWLMLQQGKPDDYVLATGKQCSVREFVEMCYAVVGKSITWQGKGVTEIGVDQDGKTRVRVAEKYYRPCEVETLLGLPTKAKSVLGWTPEYDVSRLAKEMVEADLAAHEGGELV